jgi:phage gp36-like protein
VPADPTPRYATVAGVRDVLSREVAEGQGDGAGGGDPDEEYATTGAALSDDALARRIRTAANQIDGALAPYYAVPFNPDEPPGLVIDLTEAIAAYLAELTHRQSEDLPDEDPAQRRYQWALDQLRAIAAGEVYLPGVDRKPTPYTGHGSVAGGPRNPVDAAMFGLDTFGLEVDSQRVVTAPDARRARRRPYPRGG